MTTRLSSGPSTHQLAPKVTSPMRRDDGGERIAAIIREVPRGMSDVLRRTVAETLLYCEAHSAGLSRVTDVVRHTVSTLACVGPWARDVPVMPFSQSLFEPRITRVFRQPGEHFAALRSVRPGATELLATPFRGDGRAFGVLWIVLHDDRRRFDLEDARRLQLIERCASAACELALFGAAFALAQGDARSPQLSKRERDVLILVARGLTNKAIADALGIGHKTVDTYRRRIADKLGLVRRADFVAYVVSRNLW